MCNNNKAVVWNKAEVPQLESGVYGKYLKERRENEDEKERVEHTHTIIILTVKYRQSPENAPLVQKRLWAWQGFKKKSTYVCLYG